MKTDFINAEWVKKYCDVEIESETDKWNKLGRPKNDGYINGSHSGHTRGLQNLKRLIERIEKLKEPKKC